MRRIILDTNAYTALMSGSQPIAEKLNKAEVVIFPSIVVGELLDGFLGGTRNEQNREILHRFREKPRTITISVTPDTAEWFAPIKQQLQKKGTPIPMNDIWIASCCMEHGAALLTMDKHFQEIDGLMLA